MLVPKGPTKNLCNKAKKTPAHIADVSTSLFLLHILFKNKYGRIYRYRKNLKRNAILLYILSFYFIDTDIYYYFYFLMFFLLFLPCRTYSTRVFTFILFLVRDRKLIKNLFKVVVNYFK